MTEAAIIITESLVIAGLLILFLAIGKALFNELTKE